MIRKKSGLRKEYRISIIMDSSISNMYRWIWIHKKIDCKNLNNSPNHFIYNKTLDWNFSENKNNNIRKKLSNILIIRMKKEH